MASVISPNPNPINIPIPPPPPLEPERTNTLALLLPHQSLFAPRVLQLLRDHYAEFGEIVHWAPVRGFGRVIIVYASEEEGERAKEEGDWLELDVEMPASSASPSQPTEVKGEKGYFSPKRKRKSPSSHGLTLRLHRLPPTPLVVDPASHHLKPPEIEKNFLISPPGSPPEGWEPIMEDAPNSATLAEDLQRALEALSLSGMHRGRRGSKEVILDEGGVRVEVEDCTMPTVEGDSEGEDMDMGEVGERWQGGEGAWDMPGQTGGSLGGLGGFPPGGRIRIAPTARPPM